MLMVAFASTPARAQNEPLKPYVVFAFDSSGSMSTATGSGPPSCGGADSRLNHARCALNKIVNSYGDMVFALGHFRATKAGTVTPPFPGGCCWNGADTAAGGGCLAGPACNSSPSGASSDMFEMVTGLVDGQNSAAEAWVNFSGNTCTAAGTDPEIWSPSGNTPLDGTLRGAKQYWLGLQDDGISAPNFPVWPAGNPGFDPIRTDPKKLNFLPVGCDPAPGCVANCCATQCRPYIVILMTDGGETCNGIPQTAASLLLTTDVDARRYRVETKPIGFGITAPNAQIEAIAHGGGEPDLAGDEGFYANDEAGLQLAISNILDDAIRTEVCNTLDDDCDNIADEGFTTGTACNNGRIGQCRVVGSTQCRADGAGTQCSAGREPECNGFPDGTPCNVVNATMTPVAPGVAGTCLANICNPTAAPDELGTTPRCNNLDDDCDGLIDEGVTGCVCVPTTEVCDGADNDCDTIVDENTSPVACSNGTCTGQRVCLGAAGLSACNAAMPGPMELCNGIDDTCDGIIDGFQETCSNMFCTGGSCTGGPAGQRTCVGGARAGLRCDTFAAPDPRNNPGGNPASLCESGPNAAKCVCNPGNRSCPLNGSGTFTACVQEVQPGIEVCNDLDDDCDGLVDETPPVACTTDANCPAITPTCNTTAGMCEAADCSINSCGGQLVCLNGVQTCTLVSGIDNTCNGIDEDCDSMVDEGWLCADPNGADNIPGNADDCPCTGPGLCNAHESCENGGVVCAGDAVGQEACNCLDDNCNGVIDEGTLCGSGATCTSCQCAFACVAGEFACPTGKACIGGFCLADPCFNFTCPVVAGDLQKCQPKATNPSDKECVSACASNNCTAPNICFLPTGECKPNDCTTFPAMCAANQNCINGTCITNPCQGVTCAAGQNCVMGQCFGSCAGVDCPAGQRCRLGVCEASPCNPACPAGQVCQDADGSCIANPCGFVVCPQGQYCNPNNGGMCEDDPCEIFDIQCATGEVCVGGTCFDEDDFKPDAGTETHVTTGGGGGCSTNGDAGGSLLLGLGLVLLLRRRRDGGAS